MKPGVFRLPRMYKIDPAWAPYYPPNRYETLPRGVPGNNNLYRHQAYPSHPPPQRQRVLGAGVGVGGRNEESIAIFPEGCEDQGFHTQQHLNRLQIEPGRMPPKFSSLDSSTSESRIGGRRVLSSGRGHGREPKTETELLLENLDKGGNGGDIIPPQQRRLKPSWFATQPTQEQLSGFGQPATLIRPRSKQIQ